ncbi:hypothetical protein [Arcobacter sp. LA11]|uniref:hypothetical protein n=1 Tax=Arcobacter sp. LA11 TaxID=1898176 RepID=UPI00093239C2|nr:hypothetical protein [Arcobacter sp. LA11]
MKKDNDVRLERIYEKQVTVFGKPLRVKRLILISLTGLLLGVLGYMEIFAIAWLVVAFFFFCLAVFSFLLYFKTILYFGEYSIESSPSGDIFVTKLHGQCTICLGELRIVKNKKGTFIQCKEDKSHTWDVHKKS